MRYKPRISRNKVFLLQSAYGKRAEIYSPVHMAQYDAERVILVSLAQQDENTRFKNIGQKSV